MGPTIQRGIIQRPVQQKPQSAPIDPIAENVLHFKGNATVKYNSAKPGSEQE